MNDEEIRRKIEVLNSKINKLSDAKNTLMIQLSKRKTLEYQKYIGTYWKWESKYIKIIDCISSDFIISFSVKYIYDFIPNNSFSVGEDVININDLLLHIYTEITKEEYENAIRNILMKNFPCIFQET